MASHLTSGQNGSTRILTLYCTSKEDKFRLRRSLRIDETLLKSTMRLNICACHAYRIKASFLGTWISKNVESRPRQTSETVSSFWGALLCGAAMTSISASRLTAYSVQVTLPLLRSKAFQYKISSVILKLWKNKKFQPEVEQTIYCFPGLDSRSVEHELRNLAV